MQAGIVDRVRALLGVPPVEHQDYALVLSGGGARACYQAGVLQYVAEAFPEARFPILTGVSAGAINAAQLANHTGTFRESAERLAANWREISADDLFEPESSLSFIRRLVARFRGIDPGPALTEGDEDRPTLLRTAPLRAYLEDRLQTVDGKLTGVAENLEQGRLTAFAITATSYTTGRTVTWLEGKDIEHWERPDRKGLRTTLTVDHIMASTALPLLFPAVRIGSEWYGDGGIRLVAPLSPAVHLGAHSVLVISTRYAQTRQEAAEPDVVGYPPAAQVIGLLMDAVFLDVLDHDALMMEQINLLVKNVPARRRHGLRPINLLVLRPSVDIGKLAGEHELRLKGALRLLTRGLGTGQMKSPDWLSMLLFDGEYITRLMELGWEDARRQHERIAAFLSGEPFFSSVIEQYAGRKG